MGWDGMGKRQKGGREEEEEGSFLMGYKGRWKEG